MSEPVPFGRYLLLRRIATGGMAEIYLAKQQGPGSFERSLVIKRILPHLASNPKFTTMFLDEAALAAQLVHPHIAQVYDFGEVDESYFIALELVKGPDLRTLIRAAAKTKRPPPVEVAVRIIAQVVAALDHAHNLKSESGQKLGIVHRDVSPQNVLVSYDGVAKLVDFGIAKANSSNSETEAGVVKGKFAYMAPEQLRLMKLDGRTDLYSAALVLYELLTLQQAIQGEGAMAISAAAEARMEPLESLRPDLPPDLIALMKRATDVDRNRRPATCQGFAGELEQLLVNWGVSISNAEVANYILSLEQALGEPLSATASTGSFRNKLDPANNPRPQSSRSGVRAAVKVPEPAPVDATLPPRRPKTGAIQALAPEAKPVRPRTGAVPALESEQTAPRMKSAPRPALSPGIEEEDDEQTQLPGPPHRQGQDDDEERTPPPLARAPERTPQTRSRPVPAPRHDTPPEAPPTAPPRREVTRSRPAVKVPPEKPPEKPPERPAAKPRAQTTPEAPARPEAPQGRGILGSLFVLVLVLGVLGGGGYGAWYFTLGPGGTPEAKPLPTELPKPKPPPVALLPTDTAPKPDEAAPDAGPKVEAKKDEPKKDDGKKPDRKPSGDPKPKGTGIPADQAVVNVEVDPEGQVTLDGSDVGPAPAKITTTPGAHVIGVVGPKGLKRELKLDLKGGEASAQSVVFEKASISFHVLPYAEDVKFDGKSLGPSPIRHPVEAFEGKHTAEFFNKGREKPIVKALDVKPGEVVTVEVDMNAE
jgi:serine/threonine-protein kinase